MTNENILNFRKINDHIATAGQPTEEQLHKLKDEGYEYVINIAPYDARYSLTDEQGLLKSLDIEYVHLPVDFTNPLLEDYLEFERNLKLIKNKKSLIHCAANYRVSVFFSHYASKYLGWDEQRCNDHIADIWDVDEFPVWAKIIEQLRADKAVEAKVAEIIGKHRVAIEGDQFEASGKAQLQESISRFTRANAKIQLILPGFPCKSPNKVDKTFGVLPDLGEYLALEQLDKICDEINSVYGPGCELTILSDGTTFSDLVGVDEEDKNSYRSTLRQHAITHNIKWVQLSAFFDKPMSDVMLRQQLIKQANSTVKTLDKFIERVKNDKPLRAEHDKWCSYLYNDMSIESLSEGSRDDFLLALSDKSYQVMHRSKALSANIERCFPDHVRLSIHQYDNAGPKFTIALIGNTKKAVAPWHSVPLLESSGEFRLLPHGEIDKDHSALVTYQGRNWMYLAVRDPVFAQFSYEIVKTPRVGLLIRDVNNIGLDRLPKEYLEWLTAQFGFVVIKDLVFDEQQDLVDFAEAYGELYQWQFGPVHVVKAEEKPTGFVHSQEKLPLHWDLSMLPLDHEKVAEDEYFCNRLIMLYCKRSSNGGGGETTVVDSRNALRLAGSEKVERWKNTDVTYYTKMTYFGGAPRTYPLVFKHPHNEDLILRYQEGSELEIQKFKLSSEQMDEQEFAALIQDVNDIAYDERCMVAYDWEENDLLLIDNYYTLHGRLPMTNRDRELWRVQII